MHQLPNVVLSVKVVLVGDGEGKNRGFGFVTMRTKEGGAKAMESLDGKEFNGRNIAVRESNG
jgi:RNA recognition motif-containing protein